MRVLHVVEVSHGGVPILARTFAARQAADGFEVHLLLPPDSATWPGTVHRWTPRRRQPWTLAAATRRLHQVVQQVRPDVVHLHSFFPGLLGRIRPLPGAPGTVYQPHSWAFEATTSPLARRALVRWEARAASVTTAVITNCEQEQAEARRLGVTGPISVVGLPLDTTHFAPVSAAEQVRLRSDLGLGEKLLVCVGRLSRQKGQDQLVRAWERRPIAGATLLLIGPGSTDELQKLAPSTFGRSIRALGAQDDVRPWLHAADVVVQPSRYEGQSVAMAEALACGRPVVMTDVNGVREAVAPPGAETAGAVVPLGDMDALLNACAERLADPHRSAHEGAAARIRAVSLFGADDVLERIHRVYEEAARTGAPSRGSR
jgi:glycosyltransferase involved in cell wall biosynthesis